jgi:hypothetical protein
MSDCPLVMITWEDSRQPAGRWMFLHDIPAASPVKCVTVGWLLTDGDAAKVICQSMADIESADMQAGGVMVIPACCVLSIERLEEVEAVSASCRRDQGPETEPKPQLTSRLSSTSDHAEYPMPSKRPP